MRIVGYDSTIITVIQHEITVGSIITMTLFVVFPMYTITVGYKSDGLTVTKVQTSRLLRGLTG